MASLEKQHLTILSVCACTFPSQSKGMIQSSSRSHILSSYTDMASMAYHWLAVFTLLANAGISMVRTRAGTRPSSVGL